MRKAWSRWINNPTSTSFRLMLCKNLKSNKPNFSLTLLDCTQFLSTTDKDAPPLPFSSQIVAENPFYKMTSNGSRDIRDGARRQCGKAMILTCDDLLYGSNNARLSILPFLQWTSTVSRCCRPYRWRTVSSASRGTHPLVSFGFTVD